MIQVWETSLNKNERETQEVPLVIQALSLGSNTLLPLDIPHHYGEGDRKGANQPGVPGTYPVLVASVLTLSPSPTSCYYVVNS